MLEIINQNGTWIQWLQRSTSGSDAYDTGSTITYGYGNYITYWVTGSVKALISHVSATDIVLEAGFYAEDYERIYVDPDSSIEFWEQCIYPSGSEIRYLILPFHIWRLGDVAISKYATIRRLIPRSGSSY